MLWRCCSVLAGRAPARPDVIGESPRRLDRTDAAIEYRSGACGAGADRLFEPAGSFSPRLLFAARGRCDAGWTAGRAGLWHQGRVGCTPPVGQPRAKALPCCPCADRTCRCSRSAGRGIWRCGSSIRSRPKSWQAAGLGWREPRAMAAGRPVVPAFVHRRWAPGAHPCAGCGSPRCVVLHSMFRCPSLITPRGQRSGGNLVHGVLVFGES